MRVLLRGCEKKKYKDRIRKRELRHGNWRQVYIGCDGMCQFPIEEGVVCGELDTLEFHEVFGEAKGGELKLQQRVLLCNYHHWSIHGEKWVNERHYPSMLQQDVQLEILSCGGYQNWLKEFNLIERRVEYDLQADSGTDKADLDYSENS